MKKNITPQIKVWTSKFGKKYTDRWNIPPSSLNKKSKETFGISTTDLFKQMVGDLNINTILEVGCNTGRKLEIISNLDNYQLFGIDPQLYALKKARMRLPTFNFIEGTVFDMPFKNSFFDLVYTYEVLIHISPKNLLSAMKEIIRVSKKYILHMEYYSPTHKEVNYRGHNNLLWKRDFEKFYLQNFPQLKTIKSRILEWNESVYRQKGFLSKIFLFSK